MPLDVDCAIATLEGVTDALGEVVLSAPLNTTSANESHEVRAGQVAQELGKDVMSPLKAARRAGRNQAGFLAPGGHKCAISCGETRPPRCAACLAPRLGT
eukprot:CAMPEP_0202059212 /NCGR_PEP_ID=MMETSP0963-20130614/34437_1 /ASSEMBLY_ACC=CAM_ASM_000494 /TAXON_ID=4773 /ORGANISM="Schizochytrium aggregatum, Strain ATCC28209" /LENGTH=99 /DNA_ID=CAMNT_0048625243 /DNA_START=112 /DNA_END=411 /DNA_ORIENTATION=-